MLVLAEAVKNTKIVAENKLLNYKGCDQMVLLDEYKQKLNEAKSRIEQVGESL